MSWTPQAIDFVREKWIKGVSAGDISRLLARDLGISKTRNAVIGKVHRLGMGSWGRDTPAKPADTYRPAKAPRVRVVSKSRPPRPGPQNRPALIHGNGRAVDFNDAPELAEFTRAIRRSEGMSAVDRVESGAGVESLNARPFFEGSGCKWPLADGMRCCNPIARGPYCEGHFAVGTVASNPLLRGQINKAARYLTRFDGIDLEPDRRVIHGKTRPRPHRDMADPSIWDEGRAA